MTNSRTPVSHYLMKDGGGRRKYKTGALREANRGKGRYDLISPYMLSRLAIVMERGAEKYDDRNWELGEPFGRFIDSAERHIQQFKMGFADEDHLCQAIFNLMAIVHLEKTMPGMDNMPHYETTGKQ